MHILIDPIWGSTIWGSSSSPSPSEIRPLPTHPCFLVDTLGLLRACSSQSWVFPFPLAAYRSKVALSYTGSSHGPVLSPMETFKICLFPQNWMELRIFLSFKTHNLIVAYSYGVLILQITHGTNRQEVCVWDSLHCNISETVGGSLSTVSLPQQHPL